MFRGVYRGDTDAEKGRQRMGKRNRVRGSEREQKKERQKMLSFLCDAF